MKTLRILLLSLLCIGLVPLTAPLLADAAQSAGLHTVAASLQAAGVADAAFIRRGKIKQRNTVGYKVVVVVGDDVDAGEVNTVEVQLELDGEGGPAPMTLTVPLKQITNNGNKRFVFNQLDLPADSGVGSSYQMTSTMKDAANQTVGEPWSQVVTVEDDGDAEVRSVTIRQLDATNFELRVLVVGDSEEDVAEVDVNILDLVGNAALPESLSLSEPGRSGGRAVFTDQTLTFEAPDLAADEVYSVLVDLKDSARASLGSFEAEVVVQGIGTFNGSCWDRAQNGGETGVDCGGSYCSPCPTAQSAVDLLDELGADALLEAADQHGVVVLLDNINHAVSPDGAVAWSAATEDGGTLVVGEGFGSVTLAGETVALDGTSSVYMTTTVGPADAGGGVQHTLALSTPCCQASWGVDDVAVWVLDVTIGGTGPSGGTSTGVSTWGAAKYADIIVGPAAHWSDLND